MVARADPAVVEQRCGIREVTILQFGRQVGCNRIGNSRRCRRHRPLICLTWQFTRLSGGRRRHWRRRCLCHWRGGPASERATPCAAARRAIARRWARVRRHRPHLASATSHKVCGSKESVNAASKVSAPKPNKAGSGIKRATLDILTSVTRIPSMNTSIMPQGRIANKARSTESK